MESLFWLILFLVCLVVEIVTLGLVSIWFTLGALVAFLLAVAGVDVWIQIAAFIVVSVLTLLAVRPFAARYINKDTVKTNVEAVAGKTVRITEHISNAQGTGRAVLNGMEWTARSADGTELSVGTFGTVVRVEGVKLIVRPQEENQG